MRYVILDTETTGFSPQHGDRMVEIGAIAMEGRTLSEKTFHHYIHPQREIPQAVVRIHGIDDAKVADKPSFPEIADEFLDFIAGSTLIIHNAEFDLNFIMYELAEAGKADIGAMPVIDTLGMARKRFPGQKNTLDALCDRFGIERGHRTLHGALLDSELLAEVYLALTGGRQFSLGLESPARPAAEFVSSKVPRRVKIQEQQETAALTGAKLPPISEPEQQAHRRMLARILEESGGALIWQESEVVAA